jgi:hypothetical protein
MDYNDNNIPIYKKYKEYREDKKFPDSWPTILANKLNLDLKNYGIGGSGNQEIINHVCQKSNEFKKGDTVIIEWTHIERFKWVHYVNDCWVRLGPGEYNDETRKFITEDTLIEILHNRTHPLYFQDIYDFEQIVNQLALLGGFDVYYWTVEKNLIYNLPKNLKKQKKYLCAKHVVDDDSFFNLVYKNGGKRIFEETNDVVYDFHMGESGHKVMADLMFNHIMDIPLKVDNLI